MKQDEKILQQQCEEALLWSHISYLHLTTAIHRRIGQEWHTFAVEKNKGMPDFFIFFPKKKGGTVFVELKSEKGKLKPEQKYWKEQIEKLGYQYYIVRSFEEFEELVKITS